MAPTGRPPSSTSRKGYRYPPEYGPLAAVTPGTPGGLMTMLAEYGTLSLGRRARPGDPDGRRLSDRRRRPRELRSSATRTRSSSGSTRARSSCPIAGAREAPEAGEMFVQHDLAATLRKLVDAERQALKAGKSRKDAIYAAYDRFYKGDIAQEIVRGSSRKRADCSPPAIWRTGRCKIEEPLSTDVQGDRRLQASDLAAGAGDAPGAQHPGERRPQGDGIQLAASTSTRSTRR